MSKLTMGMSSMQAWNVQIGPLKFLEIRSYFNMKWKSRLIHLARIWVWLTRAPFVQAFEDDAGLVFLTLFYSKSTFAIFYFSDILRQTATRVAWKTSRWKKWEKMALLQVSLFVNNQISDKVVFQKVNCLYFKTVAIWSGYQSYMYGTTTCSFYVFLCSWHCEDSWI